MPPPPTPRRCAAWYCSGRSPSPPRRRGRRCAIVPARRAAREWRRLPKRVPATLYVCRSCPRGPWRGGVAAGEGERFAQAVRAALAASPLASHLDLLVLHCLGGCPKPCNAALTGAGKVLLRFNRL